MNIPPDSHARQDGAGSTSASGAPGELASPRRVSYAGKRALVMGLGVHGGGVGVARYLADRGASVTVTDLQPEEKLAASLEKLRPYNITYVLGEHRDADFASADFVIRNPGVPHDNRFLQIAAAHRVPVYMEMTLFFLDCPSDRIVGVTGTRGKTTTTTLTGEMLKAAGRQAVVAGNLRVSALEQLPRITPETDVVLELSSFQLEGLEAIARSPRYAAITNLLNDHLNRYRSLADYFDAKKHIYRYQRSDGVLVLNRDNEHTRALAPEAHGRVIWFGHGDVVPGAGRARLRGAHNQMNMAAAAALARATGVDDGAIETAVASFAGVPYRQELIREVRGVQFINDTTATTPDATLAALSVMDRPVVLICGGSDKGLDFSALGELVQAATSPVKATALLDGSATDKLAAALGSTAGRRFSDLAGAVHHAVSVAQPGDVVLLSPGCASFGMFANEFDRGDQFNAIVRAL